MDTSKPRFLQGMSPFNGTGLTDFSAIPDGHYQVPFDKRAQLIYFRAGNSSDDLITVAMMNNGKLLRYFPIGAKASLHVSLAVTEDLGPETKIDLQVAAPSGVSGSLVFDIGFVEI